MIVVLIQIVINIVLGILLKPKAVRIFKLLAIPFFFLLLIAFYIIKIYFVISMMKEVPDVAAFATDSYYIIDLIKITILLIGVQILFNLVLLEKFSRKNQKAI